MAGNQQRLQQMKDFKDPFNAGQMVGMITMLTFLEKNGPIPDHALQKLKWVCANNAQYFLDKPPEDILMMAEGMVKDIERM